MVAAVGTFVPSMSRDFCRLSVAGGVVYAFGVMPRTFRQALLEACTSTGKSLAEVARGASVSYEQLKKVGQRETASTNIDDAVRVANFFGLTIDEFLQDKLASDRIEAVRLWSELTEAERDILRAAARGLDAQGRAGD